VGAVPCCCRAAAKAGRRDGFVVPAEVGHATYAVPLVECLCGHFEQVKFVACREKLFPELSEDAWLLYCAGFGVSFCRSDAWTSTKN
jgi:hypothetical protein